MTRNERGFTLIEVVVVVCIVGILSAVALMNYHAVQDKAKAAQVATALHAIEDGIIGAMIDGMTLQAFGTGAVTRVNFSQRNIAKYLSPSHFSDLPRGIDVTATASAGQAPGEYTVVVMVTGDKGTERILDDLEKMFPKTITHFGTREFVIVDSSILAPKPKSS